MNTQTKEPFRALRILMVVDSHFPGNGGTEAQAQLLAELLKARGHSVDILAPHIDERRPLQELIRGVRVLRITYPKLRSIGAFILIGKFAAWLLTHRKHYDAVHIHMARNLAAGAGLVQGWIRIPVLVKISGAWEFDGGVLDPRLKRNPLMFALNACIRRVNFMQAISEKTRQMLLDAGYGSERIQMIPNVVDVSLFESRAASADMSSGTPRVLYVGRLQPVKGISVLIEAWPIVRAAVDARLIVVGDGPLRKELEARASELGIASSVVFAGRSNNVPEFLSGADVFVQPSFQEGLPNSVLEAMSAALPIVATRVGGNEELVRDGLNGSLVPPGEPRKLAEAIIGLLQDPSRARNMGAASREFVESRYSAAHVLGLLEQSYQGHLTSTPDATGAS